MEIEITPRAPFDFAATARFFRFTQSEIVDVFSDKRYARAFRFAEKLHLLNVESRGTRSRPSLALWFTDKRAFTGQEESEARKLVERMFSTDHDLKKFRAQVAQDQLMRRLEEEHRGLHLACWPTLFEALAISILSQQISTKVAMTLKRRMVEKFGEQIATGDKTFFAFPSPEAIARASVEDLRAIGLSGAKALSMIELAQRISAGELDESELENEENETLIARLTRLRGIGRWTAEWALMLHFGRTDVFPAGDLALRLFVEKYYNDWRKMTEREIRALAQARWGRWASYAAIYFLAGLRAGMISTERK
ncbi:MAG TPA: AlkA N-terminal domain-containing protein [Pyrinomonadaceae bacterium]|nr:AlkA N-terminal domain-containing protein [Pyrinomonadaceae bacterium]